MSIASKQEIRDLYMDIPKEAYRHIADKMGWSNRNALPNIFSGALKISVFKLDMIRDALFRWKKHEAFSVTNHSGVFDPWQHSKYYKALTDLINGEEYRLLSDKNKTYMVEEHKRIGKQIQEFTKEVM